MTADLIPEQRTDATGRTQRRWVKGPRAQPSAATVPAPSTRSTDGDSEAALRRALARVPTTGAPVTLQLLQHHPAYTAYARAAAHCEAVGDDGLIRAMLSHPDGRVVMAAGELIDLMDAIAGLPVLLREDPPQKRYKQTLDRVKRVLGDYYESGAEDDFDAAGEAEFIGGALVANVLRLPLRRRPLAEGVEQIRLIGRDIGLFTRNLTPLYLLREEMWPNNIDADAETLRDLCAAMEEHGRLDLTHVAAAVAERGRLDRDEALRILLADAPALTDGML